MAPHSRVGPIRFHHAHNSSDRRCIYSCPRSRWNDLTVVSRRISLLSYSSSIELVPRSCKQYRPLRYYSGRGTRGICRGVFLQHRFSRDTSGIIHSVSVHWSIEISTHTGAALNSRLLVARPYPEDNERRTRARTRAAGKVKGRVATRIYLQHARLYGHDRGTPCARSDTKRGIAPACSDALFILGPLTLSLTFLRSTRKVRWDRRTRFGWISRSRGKQLIYSLILMYHATRDTLGSKGSFLLSDCKFGSSGFFLPVATNGNDSKLRFTYYCTLEVSKKYFFKLSYTTLFQ